MASLFGNSLGYSVSPGGLINPGDYLTSEDISSCLTPLNLTDIMSQIRNIPSVSTNSYPDTGISSSGGIASLFGGGSSGVSSPIDLTSLYNSGASGLSVPGLSLAQSSPVTTSFGIAPFGSSTIDLSSLQPYSSFTSISPISFLNNSIGFGQLPLNLLGNQMGYGMSPIMAMMAMNPSSFLSELSSLFNNGTTQNSSTSTTATSTQPTASSTYQANVSSTVNNNPNPTQYSNVVSTPTPTVSPAGSPTIMGYDYIISDGPIDAANSATATRWGYNQGVAGAWYNVANDSRGNQILALTEPLNPTESYSTQMKIIDGGNTFIVNALTGQLTMNGQPLTANQVISGIDGGNVTVSANGKSLFFNTSFLNGSIGIENENGPTNGVTMRATGYGLSGGIFGQANSVFTGTPAQVYSSTGALYNLTAQSIAFEKQP